MHKQTYTQRVQALAEKMAQDQRNIYYSVYLKAKNHYPNEGSKWSNQFHIQNWEKVIVPGYIANARIAVADMADMAKCLYHSRFVREGYSNDKAQEYTQKELKYQGLIPDNETDTDTRNIAGNTIPAGPDNAQEGGKEAWNK